MQAIFFKNQFEFREWLALNHNREKELIVGYYKIATGKPSMTWSQSVDEALCYGWIDGIRRSIDAESYCIRFTPRKPNSNWSSVNIKKIDELIKSGLIQPAGLEAFRKRKEEKSGTYSFENVAKQLPQELEMIFNANKSAWEFFTAQTASYQKTVIHWILSAKQEKTRLSRLKNAIDECEKSNRLWIKYK
jgi:uncharacterized protein YdeI (YjbR/CyaY-like superfamily)